MCSTFTNRFKPEYRNPIFLHVTKTFLCSAYDSNVLFRRTTKIQIYFIRNIKNIYTCLNDVIISKFTTARFERKNSAT